MITGLHHFGMMVEDLAKETDFYKSLGFQVFMEFEMSSIGAKAVMLQKDGSGIELWQFEDPSSEFAEKIKKHSAFSTDDLEVDLQKYLNEGYELAIPIDSSRVVKRYAYIKDKAGNYIELCELLV